MLTAAAILATVMSLGASPAAFAAGGHSGYDCMTNPGTDALQCHGSFGGGGSAGGGGGIHETFTSADYTFSGGRGGGGSGSGGGGGEHCTLTFSAPPIECTGRQ